MDFWKAQTEPCVHQDSQEKGTMTPQETDPDLPVTIQVCLAEAWVQNGLLQGLGH